MAMSMQLVVDNISRSPPDDHNEALLQGVLSNLVTGFNLGHINRATLRSRVDKLVEIFMAESLKDRSRLWAALVAAMDAFREADHYLRGEVLDQYLDFPAVTLQSDAWGAAGGWWLGASATAKTIADKFRSCRGQVGAPNKAIWLTPYTGEIEDICLSAQSSALTRIERNAIVTRAIAKLGLCNFHSNEGVLALITEATIGELVARGLGGVGMPPMGSTAIEARCHPRFRPWPRPDPTDRDKAPDHYGRTYDLDPDHRVISSPPRHHGAPEAARTAMDISEFAACIYLGEVPATPALGDQGSYVAEIGARGDSVSILKHLAGILS